MKRHGVITVAIEVMLGNGNGFDNNGNRKNSSKNINYDVNDNNHDDNNIDNNIGISYDSISNNGKWVENHDSNTLQNSSGNSKVTPIMSVNV